RARSGISYGRKTGGRVWSELLSPAPMCRLVVYGLLLAFPSLLACAGSRGPVTVRRFHMAVHATAPGAAVAGHHDRPPGPLTRAEVEALVARGLGSFLARVEVSPVLTGGRFVGFRLDAARDLAAWRASGADVCVGDVVLRVNGIQIERPEQA